jgi:hypothetical protein
MIPFLNSLRNTPLTKPVFSKLRKRRRTRFTCVTRPRGSYLLFFSPFDWGNNPEVHGGHMQLKLLTCSLWKASSCLTATLPRTSDTEWLGVVVRLDAELRDCLYIWCLLCSPTSPPSRTPSIRTSHQVMLVCIFNVSRVVVLWIVTHCITQPPTCPESAVRVMTRRQKVSKAQ